MKQSISFTATSVAFACIASPAIAQTVEGSETITVTAEVVGADQAPIEVTGQSANFGRIFIPREDGNVCVYVIDEKGDPRVEGPDGTSNPEAAVCDFGDAIAPPVFLITGQPGASFQLRLIANTSDAAATAQLKLTINDGEVDAIYPPYVFNVADGANGKEGEFTFNPKIRLEVPSTASDFASGDIGTLTAEVSY